MINNYSAYSLGDFVNIVSDIGKRNSAVANTPPVLWFRGQRKYDWDLEPIIFRTIARERLKTEENARLEHFMAKNTHYFGREFTCKSEWLEVMQHHAVKTRMLDWSESAMHSLIFTLECFFKSDTHLDADRKSAMPCMWVFEAQKWNRYVIENIIKDAEIQKTVLDLYDNQSDKSEAQKRIDQIIAGGSSDSDGYVNQLHELAKDDSRIIFTGFVQGRELEELYSNAYVYCLPSELEGMPLSLLEAMSYGNCCLTSDIPECVDVIRDKGVSFITNDKGDLIRELQRLDNEPDVVENYRKQSADYICNKYNWDDVTNRTLNLYRGDSDENSAN